jgi:nitroreductase
VPLLAKPAVGPRREDLARLYEASWAPLWVDEAGRPTQAALDAIAAIRTAPEDGLDSLDYSGARLDSVAAALSSAPSRTPVEVGRFDLGLSLGVPPICRRPPRRPGRSCEGRLQALLGSRPT